MTSANVPTWTLAEAAAWLDPPVSAEQLRAIVGALRIPPARAAGKPRGSRGRPATRYDVAVIISLHAALVPWLQLA